MNTTQVVILVIVGVLLLAALVVGLRERRARLELRELDPVRREELTQEWQQVQTRFVDEPVLATSEAHVLVRRVLSERGYPTEDLDSQTDLVSVDHPEVVGDYREAVRRTRAGEKGEATTEDLREAMVHYRSLFSRLLDGQDDSHRHDQAPPR